MIRYNLKEILSSVLTAFHRLQLDYTAYHEKWEEDEISVDQKTIRSEMGAAHCLSIGGIDFRQPYANPKNRNFLLQPIFSLRFDSKITAQDEDLHTVLGKMDTDAGENEPESDIQTNKVETKPSIRQNLFRGQREWSSELATVLENFSWLQGKWIR